jgi:hypothetical protein
VVNKLESANEIGIVGNKLIRPDGSIFHAGIGFLLSKCPSSSSSRNNNWWNSNGDGHKNCPLPFYVHQGCFCYNSTNSRTLGRSGLDSRANIETELEAVSGGKLVVVAVLMSPASLLISAQFFYDIGGLNESLSGNE